jgi:CRP-like cAMP-binding protein
VPFRVANIVGGVSAMATMDGQELAAQRRVCDEFEKMLAQHRISEDVAQATRQFLRMDMHDAHADIDQLPMSVRTRIREERFADTLISQPLFKGLTRRFINACIACVHEDTYVAGLDVVREHDVPNKCSIILDGFAAILVNDPENIDNEGGAVAVATLIPGSCFGAEGFMTSTAMTWTVQAKTLLKTISFSEADRDHLEERYPHDFHKLRTNLLNNTQQIETAAARLAEQMIEKADIEARQAAAQAEADRDSASRLFGEIDIDGSGELDLGEIRSLVNRLGLPLSNNQVKDALAQMDWNGDGAVTQTDFMEWYETARSIDRQSDSAVETQMIQGIEAKVSAQQKWGRLKGNLKDAAGMTTNKNRMSLFVKGLPKDKASFAADLARNADSGVDDADCGSGVGRPRS